MAGYEPAVRIRPSAQQAEEACVRVNGGEITIEKGPVLHSFTNSKAVFLEGGSKGALQGQEEVFAHVKDKAMEVFMLGGRVGCLAFGGKGSGKSHTLFGRVEQRSPGRRTQPATPRDGMRCEGLLLRFAAAVLPVSLSFVQVTQSGDKCLLTGSSTPVSFRITDTTTLARLTSRSLSAAAPQSTIVATLHHAASNGTFILAELGEADGGPFRSIVESLAETRNPIYPLEEELARHSVTSSLAPLLQSCNYGISIACVNPSVYAGTTKDLWFLDKMSRVTLWPIPINEKDTGMLIQPPAPGVAEAQALQTRLEEERRLRSRVEAEATNLRQRTAEAQGELSGLKDELLKKNTEIKGLRGDNSSLAGKVADLHAEMQELSAKTRNLMDHNTQAETECNKLEIRARKGSEIRENMALENRELRGKLGQALNDIKLLKEDLNTVGEEKQRLAELSQRSDDEALKAAAEQAQMQIMMSQERSDYHSVYAEVQELRKAPDIYEAEIKKLAKDHRAARMQNLKLTAERKQLQQAIAILKQEFDNSGREHFNTNTVSLQQITALETEVAAERAQNEKLKSQMQQIRAAADETIESLSSTLSSTTHQLKVEASENHKLKEMISKLATRTPTKNTSNSSEDVSHSVHFDTQFEPNESSLLLARLAND
eukprot:TRINITY_DN2324_c2_g3_i1.p1 TRINITY_DN2324_c2_g3~~TRINITY_DN2324_c2_g3_i1.p1  ORF type:complete len:657 (+),score=143.86 TRINITY_DN2324_c2_g3_i1:76-2046(+)